MGHTVTHRRRRVRGEKRSGPSYGTLRGISRATAGRLKNATMAGSIAVSLGLSGMYAARLTRAQKGCLKKLCSRTGLALRCERISASSSSSSSSASSLRYSQGSSSG